ncbi:5-deoxy-glucuronate isomerase [Sporosarcina sp. CAU 1771]
MSKLIIKSTEPKEDGSTLKVTPESAGWDHVGFEVFKLEEGQVLSKETLEDEKCLILLSGRADVKTKESHFENIGKRMSVFEWIPPYSVYVPSDDQYEVKALTKVELAVCSAPGKGNHKARLIAPKDVGVEERGSGNVTRHIHNILPEEEPADSLLVVEVLTPQGSWSGFPPHKHDIMDLPNESYLEETYYHKINPPQGFAFQRVYTDDRSLDETMAVENDQAVIVPKGYHPVAAPPGYDVYFINVMAGPERVWKFKNDPQHEWFLKDTKVY